MNALTTTARPSLLMDPQAFDHMQRVGKMLALSPLFPDHLRKGSIESAVANGVLVMNMAARLNEDPLTVAQNIYFVSGKPGWGASYMIGKANQHGVFRDPIDWDVKGKGQDLSVTAFAVLAATGKRVSVTCDMAMARAEGWTSNKKYQSMPEQMLRYRSATFLIRLYCPEVMIGVPAAIEHELSMKDVTPDYMPDAGAERIGSGAAPEEAEVANAPEPTSPRQRREERPRTDATPYAASKPSTPASNPAADDLIAKEAARVAEERAAKEEKARLDKKKADEEEAARQAHAKAQENLKMLAEKEAAEAAATAEGTPHDPETGEVMDEASNASTEAAPKPDRQAFEALYDTIVTDMMEGTNPDDVADMYGPQIELMAQHFPDLHARLQAEIAAAKE